MRLPRYSMAPSKDVAIVETPDIEWIVTAVRAEAKETAGDADVREPPASETNQPRSV